MTDKTREATGPIIDTAKIGLVADQILASRTSKHGTEKDLVQLFRELFETGHYDDLIPLTAECSILYEQCFKYGRADIVVYHSDGSVSVIEAKNGSTGYTHVVSGIGQATMYAVQMGGSRGAVTRIQRCLLWTGTEDMLLDVTIEDACRAAGVISLAMPPMKVIMATREAAGIVVEGALNGCAQEG